MTTTEVRVSPTKTIMVSDAMNRRQRRLYVAAYATALRSEQSFCIAFHTFYQKHVKAGYLSRRRTA